MPTPVLTSESKTDYRQAALTLGGLNPCSRHAECYRLTANPRQSERCLRKTRTDKSEIFYGWFVVIACFFRDLSLGETMWSFGVFFKPLENEFHGAGTLVSSGYTAFLIA